MMLHFCQRLVCQHWFIILHVQFGSYSSDFFCFCAKQRQAITFDSLYSKYLHRKVYIGGQYFLCENIWSIPMHDGAKFVFNIICKMNWCGGQSSIFPKISRNDYIYTKLAQRQKYWKIELQRGKVKFLYGLMN